MTRQARFQCSVEPTQAHATLDLQGIAASDVDEIEIVARQRCEKDGLLRVGEDRSARGEFMCDLARAEPGASGQWRRYGGR